MVYQWKSWGFKTDPQVAGEVCEKLEETVGLTNHNLVEASRPEDAPLHNEFEWDDEAAAEKYRESQAGTIIRQLVVVREEENVTAEPVRAFFTLDTEPKKPATYETTSVIMSDISKRNRLLEIALFELRAFERKYQQLSELEDVFKAIEKVTA